MSDLVKRLRDGCNLQQRDGERAADRIEQLERELAKLSRDYDECRGEFDKAASELDAERALADRLAEWLDYLNTHSKSCQSDEDADIALAAYRKARGLK